MTTILFLYAGFGLLMIGLSIPLLMEKIPPNPWYGFRVPSTLSDTVTWYKANRYLARWLLPTGIITVLGALDLYAVPGLSVDTYAWLCLAVLGMPFLATILASFRYLRRLPK